MSAKPCLDTYAIRAQLWPSLLTVLPLGLGLLAWTGSDSILQPTIAAALATCGISFAMAALARNCGRELQPKLWRKWGGPPIVQLLRHRGIGNVILRGRWHKYLETLLGETFPSAVQEREDPQKADAVYEAAAKLLIERQRKSPESPLLAKENAFYGFCRNLLALKPIGVATTVVGSISAITAIFCGSGEIMVPVSIAAINSLFLLAWILIIKPSWVLQPALAYSERLLESCTVTYESRKPN